MTNFKSPDKETAYLPLIAVAVLTIIPLYIILFFVRIIKFITKLIENSKGKDSKEPIEETEPEAIKMIA